jgi:protein transport protein SEC24
VPCPGPGLTPPRLLGAVPVEYFCALDANGRRQDADQRPELARGSVEFVAPQEYMVRPPMPPVYLFVIDVSANAIASGMLPVSTPLRDWALFRDH